MNILELLQHHSDSILSAANSAVVRVHLKHYEQAGTAQTQDRLKMLYDLTSRAIKEKNLAPMIAHAEKISAERFTAGFDLWEVQTAFNVLEEAIWNSILKEISPKDMAEALGLVSTVLGAGKDALARKYVSLASKNKATSLNLESLFSGGAN